ncbi:hypothetical protein SAMN05216259_11326 [Actinacidiphila guanduensis]|uniref:Uncharacterized protein n=1 Tax=Actinacidiphila guanduensis TaxID=310781 RepID=A0A1H0MN73_9ACTN|nr:hypothetical protein SAMN05216259_11326 [Actinacidiphila guanduensis]
MSPSAGSTPRRRAGLTRRRRHLPARQRAGGGSTELCTTLTLRCPGYRPSPVRASRGPPPRPHSVPSPLTRAGVAPRPRTRAPYGGHGAPSGHPPRGFLHGAACRPADGRARSSPRPYQLGSVPGHPNGHPPQGFLHSAACRPVTGRACSFPRPFRQPACPHRTPADLPPVTGTRAVPRAPTSSAPYQGTPTATRRKGSSTRPNAGRSLAGRAVSRAPYWLGSAQPHPRPVAAVALGYAAQRSDVDTQLCSRPSGHRPRAGGRARLEPRKGFRQGQRRVRVQEEGEVRV